MGMKSSKYNKMSLFELEEEWDHIVNIIKNLDENDKDCKKLVSFWRKEISLINNEMLNKGVGVQWFIESF
jgi:hypothetical protein